MTRKVTKPRQAASKSWLDKHQVELDAIARDLMALWRRTTNLLKSVQKAERR